MKDNSDKKLEKKTDAPKEKSGAQKNTAAVEKPKPPVKKSPIPKVTSENKKPAKGRSVVIALSLIIALSATGLAVYDYWLLEKQTTVNTQQSNEQVMLQTRISQLEQQLQKTNAKLSTESLARKDAQSEHQALNATLQNVSEKLGRSTVAWRMAEVEYLLTVANHRLTLAHDQQTAMAVFATADDRLKAIGDPALLPVRKKIASELTALRAVQQIDIPGLALQVGSLAEGVMQLPLTDKKRLAIATEKQTRQTPQDWQEIPAAVWSDIKSLVQVRRHQQPTEPLLPPQQAWFLYQNLQLKFEQARLAVLQHNTAVFRQSVNEAADWLQAYFDSESSAVVSVQNTLTEMREIELQPALPDVSGSLRELRMVMNKSVANK
jgi:uroporphyrin-III C-methyltransferase